MQKVQIEQEQVDNLLSELHDDEMLDIVKSVDKGYNPLKPEEKVPQFSWDPLFREDFGFDNALNPLKYIRYRVVYMNESWDIFVESMKGAGKSSVALSIANLLDPSWNMNKMAFSTEDWLNIEASRGDAVFFDEQGTQQSGSSHKWNKQENQDLADETQLNRTDGVINIGVSLDSNRVINRMRNQFKVFVYPYQKRSDKETGQGLYIDCVFLFISENVYGGNFDERYLKRHFRYAKDGLVRFVRVPHPPKHLWDIYSRKRAKIRKEIKEQSNLKRKQKQAETTQKNKNYDNIKDLKKKYGSLT